MKAQYENFFDELHQLFEKHNVNSMTTVDSDGQDEDCFRIKFCMGYDEITFDNYACGNFRNVCAPETYFPKGDKKK